MPANAPRPGEILLEADKVEVAFAGLRALQEVSFSVMTGDVFGLLGPNGAGKTTLLSAIAGFTRPSSGKIIFGGRDVTAFKPDRRCRVGIARTFQITQPFAELTVEENVMVGTFNHHRTRRAMAADSARYIAAVGLWHKRCALAKELSTGQRKRLELARAMATRPKLLLLDEVTGGVDQPSIPGLIELIGSLRDEGITTIVVEHNMRVMTQLASRVMFLNRGKVVTEGLPVEVMRHPAVEELYLRAAHA